MLGRSPGSFPRPSSATTLDGVRRPGRMDGATLREAMLRFHQALQAHLEEINSLNVYPVPDGDTGTNMLLTQQAVRDAVDGLDGSNLEKVGAAVARAALM